MSALVRAKVIFHILWSSLYPVKAPLQNQVLRHHHLQPSWKTTTFIPPMTIVTYEFEHIPFILEVRLGPYPHDTLKRKWSSSHNKETTPSPKVEELGSVSMLLDYIAPRLVDAHKIKIGKNEKYLLVKLTILTGVQITMNNGKIPRLHSQH